MARFREVVVATSNEKHIKAIESIKSKKVTLCKANEQSIAKQIQRVKQRENEIEL